MKVLIAFSVKVYYFHFLLSLCQLHQLILQVHYHHKLNIGMYVSHIPCEFNSLILALITCMKCVVKSILKVPAFFKPFLFPEISVWDQLLTSSTGGAW